MDFIREVWIVVLVPTAAAIAAVFGFAKTYLENQRLQLEVARLRDETAARNARIHQPSLDEVVKYAPPRTAARHRSVVVSSVAVSVILAASAISIGTRLSSPVGRSDTQLRAQLEETRRLSAATHERLGRTEAAVQAARAETLERSRLIEQKLARLSVPAPAGTAGDDELQRAIAAIRRDVAELTIRQDQAVATVSEMAEQMTAATTEATPVFRQQLEYLEKIGPYLEDMRRQIDALQRQHDAILQKLEQIEQRRGAGQ